MHIAHLDVRKCILTLITFGDGHRLSFVPIRLVMNSNAGASLRTIIYMLAKLN